EDHRGATRLARQWGSPGARAVSPGQGAGSDLVPAKPGRARGLRGGCAARGARRTSAQRGRATRRRSSPDRARHPPPSPGLSIAAQTAAKRGAFVSRVTADVDTIGQFLEWGGMSWITSTALMFGTAVAMFVYSWQLALVVLLAVSPLFLVLRMLQKGMLRAYDRVRTRVGETLSAVSESLMGAAVVRAYGLEEPTNRRLKEAIRRRYKAEMYGARFQATIFPMADLFGAAA